MITKLYGIIHSDIPHNWYDDAICRPGLVHIFYILYKKRYVSNTFSIFHLVTVLNWNTITIGLFNIAVNFDISITIDFAILPLLRFWPKQKLKYRLLGIVEAEILKSKTLPTKSYLFSSI